MTRKEIQRYFNIRPSADELYTVGSIVFINPTDAAQYATGVGSVVETHLRIEEAQAVKVTRKKAKK